MHRIVILQLLVAFAAWLAPMKISAIALQVRTALNTWALTKGGKAEVAGDFAHLFAILSAKPGAVRAAIFVPGEDKRGEHEEASVVDRKFSIFISRGRGFALEPGDSLVKTTAGAGAPLFDLVEEAQEIVRGLSFESDYTEVTPDYLGFRVAELPSDTPLDVYELNFQLGCTLNSPVGGAVASLVGGGVHVGLGQLTNVPVQTLTNVPAGVDEVYDDWNAYAAGTFTAPAQAFYLLEVAYASVVSGFEWQLYLHHPSLVPFHVTAWDALQYKRLATVVKLAALDQVKISVQHDSGAPRNFGVVNFASDVNFFKAHRIG